MNISHGLSACLMPKWPVLTIGNFDGQHRGHQHLLAEVCRVAKERGGSPMVLTFDPHPIQVLRPGMNLQFLTSSQEKFDWFEEMGMVQVVILEFTPAFAALTPQEFVNRILRQGIGVRDLLVGDKFVFGKDRAGNIDTLRHLASSAGFELHSVDPMIEGGSIISSTRVRRLVRNGELEEAHACLGRPYALSGEVIPGVQRGEQLGYRTANLRLPKGRVIPPDGVYVTKTFWKGAALDSVSYIGTSPTFGEGERLLEVHLLDHDYTLYGEHISVHLIERLRGDQKFNSADELSERIALDVRLAKDVLAR